MIDQKLIIKIMIVITILTVSFSLTDVSKCQDFRSPFGALVDCNNRTHFNCSDEQRLLFFLMRYEINCELFKLKFPIIFFNL